MDEKRPRDEGTGAVRKGMIDDGTAETEDMSDRRDRSLSLPSVHPIQRSVLRLDL